MIRIKRTWFWLFGLAALGFSADAPAEGDGCRAVRAEIDLAAGTISGNAGLNGTILFASDGAGTPPPTAPEGSSVFSGLLTLSTDAGSVELRETGMFSSRGENPRGALLTSFGEVLTGTGRFEGASGDLFFMGRNVEDVFLLDVRGVLCR
jgi:hypothetical protein